MHPYLYPQIFSFPQILIQFQMLTLVLLITLLLLFIQKLVNLQQVHLQLSLQNIQSLQIILQLNLYLSHKLNLQLHLLGDLQDIHKPSYLQSYHCNQVSIDSPILSFSNQGTHYPLSSFLSYEHLSNIHKHFCNMISSTIELENYQ